MTELTKESILEYLIREGITQSNNPDVTTLGGGVSNHVFKVSSQNECIVIKQPLPNLAVEDDWPSDIERIHNEATAMRVYSNVLKSLNLDELHIPSIRFEDSINHIIGMDCAPEDTNTWKSELLKGKVRHRISTRLGKVLGFTHQSISEMTEVRKKFPSKTTFNQLRLDPYHRTTAERNPDVSQPILSEVKRIEDIGRTLIHGDFSPKNILVGENPKNPEIWLIDFEVAHWGDPTFDVAFMLNHLLIKSVYNNEYSQEYIDAAFGFFEAYDEQVTWDIEPATIRELAVLMLARIDGKSPVEYVKSNKIKLTLRNIAKHVLLDSDIDTLSQFEAVLQSEVETL